MPDRVAFAGFRRDVKDFYQAFDLFVCPSSYEPFGRVIAEALDAGVDMVLLDNMPLDTIREAVRMADGRCSLEISGGVTFDTLRAYAETGVDRISVGGLTKDVKAVDFSMRFSERPLEA